MRKDQFEYTPKFLLMIHGNHRPRLVSDGGAMARRMHLLPCRNRPKHIDKTLIDKLKAELGGIMRWAILGAVLWRERGLDPPPKIKQATDDYIASENVLATWVDERCEGSDKSLTSFTQELYADYTAWAKASGEYVLSQKRFADALDNLGFERWKHPDPKNRRRGFRGIALKVRNEELGV